MKKKFVVPIILGAGREGRRSEAVAKFVAAQAKVFGFQSPLIDVRDFEIVCDQKGVRIGGEKRWEKLVNDADGFIFVVPEYNHSYPGEFKMLMDSTTDGYWKKPAATVGVSSGGFGGTRMIEAAKLLYLELGMVALHSSLPVSRVEKVFDKSGKLLDQSYEKRTNDLLKEMKDYLEWLQIKA